MKNKVILGGFIAFIGVVLLGIVGFDVAKKQSATNAALPSPVATATQPTPTPQPNPAPAKFNLGGCASIAPVSMANTLNEDVATNGGGFGQYLYIQTSTIEGWNFVIVPASGYCLLYPSDWQVREAGAYGNNLMFNEPFATGTRQIVFLQGVGGGLPIEQADEATASAGEGGVIPIVDPVEKLLRKEIETIGDKQVLFESSEHGTTTINRYFVGENGRATDVFQSSFSGEFVSSTDYAVFLSTLKQVVSSMKFVR